MVSFDKTVKVILGNDVITPSITSVPETTPEPQFAMAPEEQFEYETLDDGTAAITKYKGNGGNILIPVKLGGIRVTQIGKFAFDSCNSLTGVIIPEGVTLIDYCAFSMCDHLETVSFPSSLRKIETFSFGFCDSLTRLSIPEGLQEIESGAFDYCDRLTSISLPDSLKYINGNPFASCPSLKEILLSDHHSVFRMVDGVLFDRQTRCLICYLPVNEDSKYTVPEGTKQIGNSAFSVDENNSVFSSVDGLLLDKNKVRLLMCPSGRRGTVVIPEGVTAIDDYAFSCAAGVTDVVVPDSVCFIGQGNFEGQSERAVTFHCSRDSYAWKYARRNGIECE